MSRYDTVFVCFLRHRTLSVRFCDGTASWGAQLHLPPLPSLVFSLGTCLRKHLRPTLFQFYPPKKKRHPKESESILLYVLLRGSLYLVCIKRCTLVIHMDESLRFLSQGVSWSNPLSQNQLVWQNFRKKTKEIQYFLSTKTLRFCFCFCFCLGYRL